MQLPHFRRWPGALVWVVAGGFLIWPCGAQASQVQLAPCHLEDLSEELLCGTLAVPEDREAEGGRELQLNIAVAPAKGASAAPDPVFVLAGGPGQGATEIVGHAVRALDDVREKRDLVFVDQRGTGRSNPLDCPSEGILELLSASGLPLEQIEDCRDHLLEEADLSLYTTFHAMPDLEAVRQALGYGPINLWGVSYGTRAAMVFQQLFPDSTRSVVLDGMAPFGVKLPVHNAREAQRALDHWFEACAGDTACAARYPNLRETWNDLLAQLEAEPREITLDHPRTMESLNLTVTRDLMAGFLRGILYNAELSATVPFLIERAAQGDLTPILTVGLRFLGGVQKTMSVGMMFSVLCPEDLSRIEPGEMEALAQGTFLGIAGSQEMFEVCEVWPKADLPEGFEQLAESAVPALLLSGDLDPVVPPVWGEATAEFLTNSLHVVVPHVGHNVSHVGCVPSLITQFLEQASVADLDASCVNDVVRPAFTHGFAGPMP